MTPRDPKENPVKGRAMSGEVDVKDLLKQLLLKQSKKAVKSLLVGNDTGCFTREQYVKAYAQVAKYGDFPKLVARSLGSGVDLVRMHLEGTDLVVEMNREHGVWMDKNQKP